ncbi:CoA transferase [Candidatus Bathyarchaeota archaeon]|nr:CoA transferase [Candidatus Bathyarchaeota archaeon]
MINLSGIKVVDLTIGLAGSYAAMALADLGADVIKVESQKNNDRDLGKVGGGSAPFIAWNRNKKSITVDLDTDEGKKVMLKLLERSDIFVEGLERGVVNSLGFSYEAVSKINPRIIFVSVKGYLEGPYGDRPTSAHCAEALSGLVSTTGEITFYKETYPYAGGKVLSGHPPLLIGVPSVPYATGNYAVIGALAALVIRARTGKGDYVQVGMFETAVSLGQGHLESFALEERLEKVTLPIHKTKDGWAYIPPLSPTRWEGFCDGFGVSSEAKKEFASDLGKSRNPEGYLKTLADAVANMTYDEIMKKLIQYDVPGAAAGSMEKLLDNIHLNTAKFFVPLETDSQVTLTPDRKTIKYCMLPISESGYNPDTTSKWKPPPKLGEHTVEILGELGYTKEGIGDLQKRKIV